MTKMGRKLDYARLLIEIDTSIPPLDFVSCGTKITAGGAMHGRRSPWKWIWAFVLDCPTAWMYGLGFEVVTNSISGGPTSVTYTTVSCGGPDSSFTTAKDERLLHACTTLTSGGSSIPLDVTISRAWLNWDQEGFERCPDSGGLLVSLLLLFDMVARREKWSSRPHLYLSSWFSREDVPEFGEGSPTAEKTFGWKTLENRTVIAAVD
nr:hypothetical protein Iba_chr03dCG0260 [Ipomoea batatas]